MHVFLDLENWLALLTLTFLEIVLGVDNLVVLAITSARLPRHQQVLARQFGLLLALVLRLLLLAGAAWIAGLTKPLFSIFAHGVSGRDILFLLGGVFLIYKGLKELLEAIRPEIHQQNHPSSSALFYAILQIAFFDLVFSLDSIVTAVGIAKHYLIMAIAIIITIFVMLLASKPLCDFINKRPRIKMLALSFIILVGVILFFEGLHWEISRSYIYVVIGFSIFVELCNSLHEKFSH